LREVRFKPSRVGARVFMVVGRRLRQSAPHELGWAVPGRVVESLP
jgi:hypothetical protein